ncbi:MAG: PhzF family phenazine biosynthesis protein [Burkholderiales bacterium]|nr:MAG: PhzF family phenazine biosynthesis protein [Burkholderiales bacterium]
MAEAPESAVAPPRPRPFKQVDVFTDRPFFGNPVAVVLDAEGLDTDAMQRIARWTNLSETTFVLPADASEADYRVRIFTPAAELPFAGHPSLGTAHALLEAGRLPPGAAVVRQQCGIGIVKLRVDRAARTIALALPAPRSRALDAAAGARIAEALGAAALAGTVRRIDVGPIWLVAPLADADTVLGLRPDMQAIARLSEAHQATGVTVYGPAAGGEQARYELRSFAPLHAVPEDPVCGSGNGTVAAWLREEGRQGDYLARQGRAIGRDGYVSVAFDGDDILVGGACVTCVDGSLRA